MAYTYGTYSFLKKGGWYVDRDLEVARGEMEKYGKDNATYRNMVKGLKRYRENLANNPGSQSMIDMVARYEARVTEHEANYEEARQIYLRVKETAMPRTKSLSEAKNYIAAAKAVGLKTGSVTRDQFEAAVVVADARHDAVRAAEREATFAQYRAMDDAVGDALTKASFRDGVVETVSGIDPETGYGTWDVGEVFNPEEIEAIAVIGANTAEMHLMQSGMSGVSDTAAGEMHTDPHSDMFPGGEYGKAAVGGGVGVVAAIITFLLFRGLA